MKKKEILRRLECVQQSINAMFSDDVLNVVSDLINDIKADYTPREFLTFKDALNKLLDGDVKKITNHDSSYCSFHCNRLAWFHNNGSFKSYDVNVLSKLPWWVVE